MVGVWTDMDRSALCVFSWRPDCIQGTRLVFDSMTMPPLRAPFQRLASDGVTAVRIMDEKHCWLKEYKVNGGHLVRSPSAVAEAAASVAVGGVGSLGITESHRGPCDLLHWEEVCSAVGQALTWCWGGRVTAASLSAAAPRAALSTRCCASCK